MNKSEFLKELLDKEQATLLVLTDSVYNVNSFSDNNGGIVAYAKIIQVYAKIKDVNSLSVEYVLEIDDCGNSDELQFSEIKTDVLYIANERYSDILDVTVMDGATKCGTIGEMIAFLKDIPDDMPVVIEDNTYGVELSTWNIALASPMLFSEKVCERKKKVQFEKDLSALGIDDLYDKYDMLNDYIITDGKNVEEKDTFNTGVAKDAIILSTMCDEKTPWYAVEM